MPNPATVVFKVVNATGTIIETYDSFDDALSSVQSHNSGLTPPSTPGDDGWAVVPANY